MGEEACVVGSAAGLSSEDEVFAQYREQGVLMWRGFTLQNFADQLYGNADDLGKGRQMPIHYGSRTLNFQTISSPLATQIPQAVGAAYTMKLNEHPTIAVCYFGEGASSEGDFHAGMNFASTLGCPVLFICRNNCFAISTPSSEQFQTPGSSLIDRARGYGMSSLKVDGNDVLAMKEATEHARNICVTESRPVFLEAMTYRVGHHSTSDDSTRYRSIDEIEDWRVNRNPLDRMYSFLERNEWITAQEDEAMKDAERRNVLAALSQAEKKPRPNAMQSVFDDVYSERPSRLKKQQQQLKEHLERYPLD